MPHRALRTKQHETAPALLGRELQAPEHGIVRRIEPCEHCGARAGPHGLLRRPERLVGGRRPLDDEYPADVDAATDQRRRIRNPRRSDEDEKTGLGLVDGGQRRKRRHQQAQLAATVALDENLDDCTPRPPAAQSAIERFEAGRADLLRRAPRPPSPQMRPGERFDAGIHRRATPSRA